MIIISLIVGSEGLQVITSESILTFLSFHFRFEIHDTLCASERVCVGGGGHE